MISYKELKQKITIEQVMKKYGMKYQKRGTQFVASCPWCGGTFKASPEKNCYKCFSDGCTAKGNILDFVAQKENITIKQAAELLHSWFLEKKGVFQRARAFFAH